MKKILLLSAVGLLAHSAFSQSEIMFDNIINAPGTQGEFPGAIRAPFYGCSPTLPYVRQSGNTPTGVPMGSTTYDGPLLNGTQFTATLWGLNSANVVGTADWGANNLALLATTTMRTSTFSANAGRVAASGNPVVISDVRPHTTDRGTFQVRVWDNRGGTILTWQDALSTLAAGRGNAIGYSDLFTVPWELTPAGSLVEVPSNLEGLRSFSLICQIGPDVPEPSLVALIAFAAGCLFLLRWRDRVI